VIAPSRPEPLYWRGFTIKLINITLGVLGTSDQPVAETSTLIHTTFTRVRHPCSRRDSNLQSHRPTWPLALGFTIILLYVCVFLAGEEPGSAGGGTYSVSETTRGGCLSCFVRRSTVAVAIALLATRLYPSAWKFRRPAPNKWPISTHTRVDLLGISSLQAALLKYCVHFSDFCLRYIKWAYKVQRGKKYNKQFISK